MAFTFPAMVAEDPATNAVVKNVSFQVYAVTDTGFSTPLPITDTFNNPLAGGILNSGTKGVFPQFQQATNSTVTIADATHVYAWTINCVQQDSAISSFINTPGSATAAALNATYAPVSTTTPKWQPTTAYTAGQQVISPNGDVVSAISTFTSGASFNASNWTVSPTFAQRGSILYNVKDFGAKGDNATDDTAAIQAAYNAAIASSFGGGLYFPPGNFVVTSAITISQSMVIRGAGSQATSIISKAGASGAFIFSADRIVALDIYFQCQASISAVTTSQVVAIKYTTGNLGVIERCYFAGWYMSVWFQSCGSWIVRDNYFSRAVLYNLKIQNTALPDSGDQVVSGNYFAMGGSYATTAHVRQESAGGLRLTNNKLLNAAIGLDLAVADAIATSILVVTDNSFEYQTTSAIRLGSLGPSNTGTFQKILIAVNQFTGNSCTSPVIDIIPAATSLMWAIKVAANIMSGTAGSTTFIHAKNVDDLSIDGNQMSTGTAGIVIDSSATNVYIGTGNKTQSVTTPVSNATPSPVVNQAWDGLVITPPSGASAQSSLFIYNTAGAAVVTVSAANGNTLFAGGVRVGGAYQNIASLYVTPTNTYPCAVLRSGGGTADLLQLMDQSTTAIRFRLDQYGHVVADGMGAPTLAAQAGAGTSPTVSVTSGGSDTAGQINVTTGTSPAAGSQVAVTFANAYGVSVRSVQLTPSSSAAAAAVGYISAKSATGFTISVANAPAGAAALSWFYQVIG